MKHFINKDKIIEANINEPFKWSKTNDKWQLVLTVSYHPIETIVIDLEAEAQCIALAKELGLFFIETK